MLILKVGNGARIPLNCFAESVSRGVIIERDFVCCSSYIDIDDCARSGKDAVEINRCSGAPGITSAGVEIDNVLGSTNRDMEKNILSIYQVEACAINGYLMIGRRII